MLGSSRAARNMAHVFISLSPPLTNFTPEAFTGFFRPPSGLGGGGFRVGVPSSQWEATKGT